MKPAIETLKNLAIADGLLHQACKDRSIPWERRDEWHAISLQLAARVGRFAGELEAAGADPRVIDSAIGRHCHSARSDFLTK